MFKDMGDTEMMMIQSGGAPPVTGPISFIIFLIAALFSAIIKIILLGTFLYFMYIIIFKTYPRFVLDLFSFSFSKKQNHEKMFTEYEFFFNHYRCLLKKSMEFNGKDPSTMFKLIYPQHAPTKSVEQNLKIVDDFIAEKYKSFKFTRRYFEAFREYYLFYDIINSPPDSRTDIHEACHRKGNHCIDMHENQVADPSAKVPLCKANEIEKQFYGNDQRPITNNMVPCTNEKMYLITNVNFYKKMLELQHYNGLNPTKHTEYLPSVAELHYKDVNNGNLLLNRVKVLTSYIDTLAKECANMIKLIDTMPVTWFISIPESIDVIPKLSLEIMNNYESAMDGTLYKQVDPNISDYTWFVFEAHKKFSYAALESQINRMLAGQPYETSLLLGAYINLPIEKRKTVRTTLLASYSHIKIRGEIVNFINKHPIFSHIFFNTRTSILGIKPQLYSNVIQAYNILMSQNKNGTIDITTKTNAKSYLSNLIYNTRHLKQYIISVYILDMFFRDYRPTLTAEFNEQILSNVDFFNAMFDPFKTELIDRRVMPYCRRTLSGKNWKATFRRFKTIWKTIGVYVKALKHMTGQAFKRGVSMPPDEAPSQDNEGASSG